MALQYFDTILIVDDNTLSIKSLEIILSKHLYNIITSHNGINAIDIANNNDIDLILLDIKMPDMDGYQVCETLKQNERTSGIPIIFITSSYDVKSIVKGFELGAVDYIKKPYIEEELIARVKNHLELKKYRENLEIEINEKIYQLKVEAENTKEALDNLITANKKLNKNNTELTIANRKAEESENLKNSFLATISHEIRTPLNGVIGFASLLKKQNLSDERREQFRKAIEDSGNILLSVIDNVIDISRISAGAIEINYKQEYLNNLIEEIFSANKSFAYEKKLNLTFSNDLTLEESFIFIDKDKLIQILGNIVNNAIKFTNTGEVSFGYKIFKNNSQKDDKIEFFVKDTGIGINKEFNNIIFKSFRQVEDTLTRTYSGTGLGLTISKELISTLGGEIWVKSEINKGSTFFFTIPYIKDISSLNKEKESIIKEKDFSDKVIIIAEDVDENFVLLKEYLRETNVKIYHAMDGFSTIELYKSLHKVDIILMDIAMPVMDGIEATKILKKINPKLIIIAQTATVLTEENKEIKNIGFDDYLEKPIEREHLLKKIGSHLKETFFDK